MLLRLAVIPDASELLSCRTEIGSSGAPWLRRPRFYFRSIDKRHVAHFWFHTETHRSKFEFKSRQLDSEHAFRLDAPAKKQFVLISDNRFHGSLLSYFRPLPITGATTGDTP